MSLMMKLLIQERKKKKKKNKKKKNKTFKPFPLVGNQLGSHLAASSSQFKLNGIHPSPEVIKRIICFFIKLYIIYHKSLS
jgi:hypothetical protein